LWYAKLLTKNERCNADDFTVIFFSGGARRLPSGLPQTYDEGFTGCIEYVLIDNEKLDLVENRESHGSVEFCDAEEIP